MRVLVTRPAEDGAQTAVRLREMGYEPLLAPLLTTRFFDGPVPDLTDVQAILATSANGVRAFARISGRRDLPLYAVGPQTAQAASEAGFVTVQNAQGDARTLAKAAMGWARAGGGTLLHVSGEEGAGTLGELLTAGGFDYCKMVLYRVDATQVLPPEVAEALVKGAVDAALFFSPRSARVFAGLAADYPTKSMIAVCISTATAEGLAPLAFADIRIAAHPDQDSLLACLVTHPG